MQELYLLDHREMLRTHKRLQEYPYLLQLVLEDIDGARKDVARVWTRLQTFPHMFANQRE